MNLLLESDKETVCAVVCNHYGLAHVDLANPTRAERVSKPRQIVYFLLRRLTGASVTNIARAFGVDHATIIYAVTAVADAMSVDREFARTVNFLEERCKLRLEAK